CGGAGGGGGIYMWAGRVEQCLFMGNRDGNGEHGAAVWLCEGGTVANCTIARNHGTYGGVVNVSGTGRVINCVIVDNTAPGADEASGGSVFHYAWQASYFQNCVADIFINGTCLTTDGGFGFADAENGDYHLTLVALALDAGAAEALVSATDLDGNPRVVNGIVDAGCYEYQGRGGALDFAFDADLTHHAAPFVVVFHTAVANAVGSVRYEWDFGDEIPPSIVPTTDPTIAHRYEEPGWHTVTATAFDEATFATMTRTAFIYTAPPVIHVVEGADDPRFPYDTFETALPTIQEAFAEADDGTLIVVSNGVYTVADTLTINKGVTVRGFTGDPDDVAFCGGYRLHQLSLSHPDARVENITLRDGEAYHNMYGGNLFISKAGGTVSNCVITAGNGNNHHGNGGGVYMNGGLVTHCFITDNWVGGGASEKGGGVRMNGGSLEHCLVARNTAPDGAGDHNSAAGVYMTGGSVINCTIAANDSRNHGGFYASGGTVVNTVIAGNSSSLFAGDAAMWGGNPNCFLNCWTDTEERINEACFTDTPDAMLANIAGGDYTPAAGSPLIDAGIEIDNPPELDLAGNPRVMGDPVAIIDVGAFESDPGKFTFTFEADVTEGNASVRVVFTAKVAGVEPGDTMRFTWDFGEGGVEFVVYDQLVVTNTYDHNDYYTVSLTLETQSGLSNTVTRTKYLHFAPEVMYVAAGNDENARIPYDDWHNAAATPQDALEFALNGCEIIVGAGVYSNSTSIKVEKRVHLHSEHNDPASVIFTNPDRVNFSLLVMDDADAWVNGVTLDRGTHEYNGANLYFATQGGTVSNCVIRDGVTHDWNGSGSAFHSDSPNALVTHCVITDNITRSDAGQDKCIIKLIAGRMENCLIANNTYDPLNINRSSVIRIFPGAIIRNCTIAGNESLKTGTVFFEDRPYYDSRPPAELVHCVIADNIAVDSGAVWHGWDGATEYGFVNCTADEYLNDTCRDAPAEVIFKNAAAGNYQLASASPAIDHGPLLSPVEIAALPAYDLLGRPRVANGHIDDGCYESKGRTTVIVIR
ncbi:MAG: PKD domain-containing protein, partial [Kiritimatiellaeota bacterium]|nr:PKD domain-containing protein [Kiritimatiellota bacterium]